MWRINYPSYILCMNIVQCQFRMRKLAQVKLLLYTIYLLIVRCRNNKRWHGVKDILRCPYQSVFRYLCGKYNSWYSLAHKGCKVYIYIQSIATGYNIISIICQYIKYSKKLFNRKSLAYTLILDVLKHNSCTSYTLKELYNSIIDSIYYTCLCEFPSLMCVLKCIYTYIYILCIPTYNQFCDYNDVSRRVVSIRNQCRTSSSSSHICLGVHK